MPYYEVDPEVLEEFGEAAGGSGAFYEAASAVFNFTKAPPVVQKVRDAFIAKGFTTIDGHYDGGYDEGFSYFDAAVVNGVSFSVDEIGQLLAQPLSDAFDLMFDAMEGPPGMVEQMRERNSQATSAVRVENVLYEFIHTLATALLGDGFGTGEYSLRGRFRVDLLTGNIDDIED